MYLVEEGVLEIVDTRSVPEVVLDIIGPGAVVGEYAFMDEAPRAADVRACEPSVCRIWDRVDLQRVLSREPPFAAAFFRAMATVAVARARDITSSAVVGGIGVRNSPREAQATMLGAQAQEIASHAREGWLEADTRLRRDLVDKQALADVGTTFKKLVEETAAWLASVSEPGSVARVGAGLSRELRPYLERARTAELCLAEDAGQAGGGRLMGHVLLGQPSGDGPFGQSLDRGILALPSCQAMRTRGRLAARTMLAGLPDRAARVLFLPASGSLILARVLPQLAERGALVTAIDGSREALTFFDAGLPSRPPNVELRLVNEELDQLASGRSRAHHEAQDFIIIDGLSEYLPDRLVAALMRWSHDHLRPGGDLIITGLGPSDDAAVFDHLLGWPLIRRGGPALRSLVEAGGLRAGVVSGGPTQGGPAVVVRGRKA